MKNFKRVVASVMATAMLASCAGMTTFMNVAAVEGPYTVNITHKDGDTYGEHTHTYVAYQIFKGECSDGYLTNIEWGDNVKARDLVNYLKGEAPYKNNTALMSVNTANADELARSAKTVADILAGFGEDSPEIKNFAKILIENSYTKGTGTTSGKVKYDPDAADPNPKATISLNNPGYYMIVDDDNHSADEQDVASTLYMLKVVGDKATLDINPKSDKPTLDKYILEDNDEVKVNTASIGDIITYRIKSKVPDMTGYNWYYFNIGDTLDETLDFQENTVSVKLKGTDKDGNEETIDLGQCKALDHSVNHSNISQLFYVEADTYYMLADANSAEVDATQGDPRKQNIKIVLENFIQYHGTEANNWTDSKEGYEIIVEYKARLMSNARIGDTYSTGAANEANVNKADLTYSNDPYAQYSGDGNKPDEPKTGEPVGKTPESMVATYTTELDLYKVDGNNNKGLAGATFEVTGNGVNVVVTRKQEFEHIAAGETATHWALRDGTFTDVAPRPEDLQGGENSKYLNAEAEYRLKEKTYIEPSTGTNNTQKIMATVGDDGVLKLQGLGAGEYTITEKIAPAGYSKADPIKVTIGYELADSDDPTNYNINWTKSANVGVDANGVFTLTIKNFHGSVLPGTGGIGTVIFYVAGSLLMACAVVLFIVKKKSEAKEG